MLSHHVILEDFGANKLEVIRVMRNHLPDYGLVKCKLRVECAPDSLLYSAITDEEFTIASKLLVDLQAAGATVELKPVMWASVALLTWNTCTETQRDLLLKAFGPTLTEEISSTKAGAYPLLDSIAYNVFYYLYGRPYASGKFRDKGPMTETQVRQFIVRAFPEIFTPDE